MRGDRACAELSRGRGPVMSPRRFRPVDIGPDRCVRCARTMRPFVEGGSGRRDPVLAFGAVVTLALAGFGLMSAAAARSSSASAMPASWPRRARAGRATAASDRSPAPPPRTARTATSASTGSAGWRAVTAATGPPAPRGAGARTACASPTPARTTATAPTARSATTARACRWCAAPRSPASRARSASAIAASPAQGVQQRRAVPQRILLRASTASAWRSAPSAPPAGTAPTGRSAWTASARPRAPTAPTRCPAPRARSAGWNVRAGHRRLWQRRPVPDRVRVPQRSVLRGLDLHPAAEPVAASTSRSARRRPSASTACAVSPEGRFVSRHVPCTSDVQCPVGDSCILGTCVAFGGGGGGGGGGGSGGGSGGSGT